MYNIRKQIQDILDNNYNTQEKIKIKGEVFTPFDLIEEMLDKLPDDVWTNPNKTWLDPAAGLGNFHAVVAERLMKSLATQIKNKEKRYKHILENQLYFIELNPKSVSLIKQIFDPHHKYKLNLVCADALDPNHKGWAKVGYMWTTNKFW
jgi:type I restriction-modification system DNA methylase subunit